MLELEPLEHAELGDKVYNLLRRAIIRRQFRPGERLDVPVLAERLGVSRTPLKDAINRLAAEGLLEIQPRRGTFVVGFTEPYLSEIYEIRLMVELWAGEAGTQLLGAGAAEALRPALAAMEAALADRSDQERFDLADEHFHRDLVALAGNGHLSDLYESLKFHFRVAPAYQAGFVDVHLRSEAALAEHREIVTGLESGDLDRLKRAIRTHIDASRELTLSICRQAGGMI